MINCMRDDLKQGFFSVRFLISCVILLLLLGSATGISTYTAEQFGVEPCSILKMFFTTDESLWLRFPFFSATEIWMEGIRVSNLGTFLPAIVSFPLVPLLTDELKSQNYRFHCIRCSYRTYFLSKCFSAMLIAFYMAVLCTLAFWLICWAVLPLPSAYADSDLGQLIGRGIPWGKMSQLTVCLAASSAMNAAFVVLLAVITVDKFAAICLPVVLSFLANQISVKLYVRYQDVRYWCFAPDYLYQPDMWFHAFTDRISAWTVLLIPVILSAGFILSAYLIAKRKMQQ